MRIVLVGPEKEENLSLRYLSAALLEAGHETEIAPFEGAEDLPSVIDMCAEADIIGLSMCFQSRAREFLEVARAARERFPETLIIAGGHFASCTAGELLADYPEIDLIGIHEGERTIVEIARWWSDGGGSPSHIPGIAYRNGREVKFTPPRPIVSDLDTLPTPDRRGPVRLVAGVPTAYLFGSRGCLGSCEYCCIRTLHELAPGPALRQRDPGMIAEEMSLLYHERGIRLFIFHDDNFLVPSEKRNRARLDALESAIARRNLEGIGFYIKCRPADLTPGIAGQLKRMGLVRLFLGVESSSRPGLQALGRGQNCDHSERALAVCDELVIPAQFNMLIFHPRTTAETLRTDIAFMRRHANHSHNFGRVELNAGTPLEQKMLRRGLTRGTYLGRGYSIPDHVSNLVWEASRTVLADRCSRETSLMNEAILLDFLGSTMRYFYAGPAIDQLHARIQKWRGEVARSSLDVLSRIVDCCEQTPDPDSTVLRHHLLEIQLDESVTRKRLRHEFSQLAAELDRVTRVNDQTDGRDDAGSQRGRMGVTLSRHLAAVAFAMTVAGVVPAFGCCDPEQEVLDGDYDGLFDDLESSFFGTNPRLKDTDADGTTDSEEDHDQDGLTNSEEQELLFSLTESIENRDIDAVRRFVERGAPVDARHRHMRYTPLGEAASRGDLDIMSYLIDAGADLEVTADGMTALDAAAYAGLREPVKLLLAHGAAVGTELRSSLWYAVIGGHIDVAEVLLLAGADPNPTFTYDTLIGRAVMDKQTSMVRILIDHGAEVNARPPRDSREPLWIAVAAGNTQIVYMLLDAGADTTATRDGKTVLHEAALRGSREIVSMLLSYGADVGAKDALDRTPIDLAREYSREELVNLMLEAEGE